MPRYARQPFDIDAARQQILERNRLRAEAHLPLLNVEGELKRLEGGGR